MRRELDARYLLSGPRTTWLPVSSKLSGLNKAESETEDMRLWLPGRGAPEPVKGVNEARLLDAGPGNDILARDMSSVIGPWLKRRLSDCSLITPRLPWKRLARSVK